VSSNLLAENGRVTRLVRVPLPRARESKFLRYFLLGLDAAALTFSWLIATVVVTTSARSVLASLLSTIALVVGGLAVFRVIGLYRARICNLRAVEYVRVARGCLIIALLGLAVAAVAGSIVVPEEIALGTTLAFLLVTVLRGGYRTWLTNRRRVGRYLRPVLLVGAGAESAELAALLAEHPELGYRTTAIVGDESEARRHGLADNRCADVDLHTTSTVRSRRTRASIARLLAPKWSRVTMDERPHKGASKRTASTLSASTPQLLGVLLLGGAFFTLSWRWLRKWLGRNLSGSPWTPRQTTAFSVRVSLDGCCVAPCVKAAARRHSATLPPRLATRSTNEGTRPTTR
jgi:hypothetical protein